MLAVGRALVSTRACCCSLSRRPGTHHRGRAAAPSATHHAPERPVGHHLVEQHPQTITTISDHAAVLDRGTVVATQAAQPG